LRPALPIKKRGRCGEGEMRQAQAPPPGGMAARMLQARLLDAASAVVDAVPRGGQVRFIRRPDVDEAALRPLLGNVEVHPRPAELEDAFMLMLRQHAEAIVGQSSSEEPPAAGTDRALQGRRNDEPTAPAAEEANAEPLTAPRGRAARAEVGAAGVWFYNVCHC